MLIFASALCRATGAEPAFPFTPEAAARIIHEARIACDADLGNLWGRNLYGPLLLVDPATRRVFSNRPGTGDQLVREGSVYSGSLPDDIPVANTAVEWRGLRWAEIVWSSIPADSKRRARLLVHELWHVWQPEFGLPPANPANAHLDTLEGRYWLQLEWRALRRALTEAGGERKRALTDALIFRTVRRRLFLRAAAEERDLELNEGLAEYTGLRLTNRELYGAFMDLVEALDDASRLPTFNRSFAYLTGPAYGLLLDSMGDTGWRRRLSRNSDLSAMVQRAAAIVLPADLESASRARADAYGGKELYASEQEREARRHLLVEEYRRRFLESPVLLIPLRRPSVSFDPRSLAPLGDVGTVYPVMHASDEWGTLEVTAGALLGNDWRWIRVTLPLRNDEAGVSGEGWVLRLHTGWRICPGAPDGYTLCKDAP